MSLRRLIIFAHVYFMLLPMLIIFATPLRRYVMLTRAAAAAMSLFSDIFASTLPVAADASASACCHAFSSHATMPAP